jgi:arsenate reductase (thioredoxin)
VVPLGEGDDGDMRPGGIRGGRPKFGGRGTLPTRAGDGAASPPPVPSKRRVLFVCIGNSCRSQMAEAFARAYGRDVIEPHSAGLSPAADIAPMTILVLGERNVTVDGQFPKPFESMLQEPFDILVNMSGVRIALPGARTLDWPVTDPIGQTTKVYQSVAAQIESLVMRLILDLRTT